MNKKTKVVVNKQLYSDDTVQKTAEKHHDDLILVPDDKYNKMVAQNMGDGSSSNSTTTTTSSSPTTSTIGENGVDAVIEPQDSETIKYLSNVKDQNTGEISKPFTIDGKNYQMIRGIKPNREVVMAVFCLDDMDEMGGNRIHSIEEFEKNIAIPMRERDEKMKSDKETFIDFLNLADAEGGKHFFVNRKTGNITNRFNSTRDMIKSGVRLGEDEDYMDAKGLKRYRYGNYFKQNVSEEDEDLVMGTDVGKLKSDVKKLAKLIGTKFSTAISKIDKPIEQVEFLNAMAEIIGVPFNKLTSLINSFKDVATAQKGQTAQEPAPVTAEHKIINKDNLLETLGLKQEIIKVKKIENGK